MSAAALRGTAGRRWRRDGRSWPGHHGAVAHEDGDRVEGHVDGDRSTSLVGPGWVEVAPPATARQVDLARALARPPDGRDQQVGPEHVLIPAVAQLLVLAV